MGGISDSLVSLFSFFPFTLSFLRNENELVNNLNALR